MLIFKFLLREGLKWKSFFYFCPSTALGMTKIKKDCNEKPDQKLRGGTTKQFWGTPKKD